MHAAPPVRIRVVPDLSSRGFVAFSACFAAANLTAWAASWMQSSTVTFALAMLLAAGCSGWLLAFVMRRSTTAGDLVWDGACWQWLPDAADPRSGELVVMIDLGPWVLVRFTPIEPVAASAWLATSRHDAAAHWAEWRTALYSPRPGSAPPAVLGPR
jgi:hypothetical protein